MKKISLSLLVILIFISSCTKDSSEEVIDEKKAMPQLSVIDISQESDWDYWVLGTEDYYFIEAGINNLPKAALYHSSSINKDFSIFFNDEGYVDNVVFEDHIFIFRNFKGNQLDLGVIYPDGSYKLFRDLETPSFNWDSLIFNKLTETKDFKHELIRWTGHAIAGVPCALSAAAAIPTGGLSLISAGVTCGMFLTRITGDVLENDFNIENGLNDFMEVYDIFGTIAACATLEGFECAHGVISFAYDVLTDDELEIEEHSEDILEINYLLSLDVFKTEFFDLDDNKVPEGWDFVVIRNAIISNGRINAYVNDGGGILSKEGVVSGTTKEIILEMDAYIAYSYWGLKSIFRIYKGDDYLGFRTGEEDYDHPKGNIANEVLYHGSSGNNYIYESLSPTITGVYHLKLTMNELGYEFVGVDPNGTESFKINIKEEDYPNYYFDFREIDEIQFYTVAQTDNNGWIDNLKVTVKE